MKLTEKILRQYIRESIKTTLNESFLCEAQGDLTNTMMKKIVNHLTAKLNSGDENFKTLLSSLGYNLNYDIKNIKNKYQNLFKKQEISQEVAEDILNAANILSNYTDKNGNIFLRRKEGDNRENVKYLEDDFSTEEVNELIRLKEFMERNGLSYLFDKKAKIGTHKYGMKGKNDDVSNLDFNNITDKEKEKYIGNKIMTVDDAYYEMKKAFVLKYIKAKYGMELKIPNISLPKGNKKLPNSTLIINFDSAVGCPAWNECIVKHACYARGTERIRDTVYQANKNRSLMWKTTQYDGELMKLLMDFVKSYCFNYEAAAREIVNNGLIKTKNFNNLIDKLSTTPLTDAFFTPEIIEIMTKNKRIDNIRLNENGDFIGQWLVDAWDNMAAELAICKIYTSAYTCRHLNYEGVKNIILNSSFVSDKGNIARHFIAIPEEIYNLLDETYNGENDSLIVNNGSITPNYKPLFDIETKQPNGRVYYKCPCDRKIGGKKINCYECQVCYQPNPNENQTIVFVKAHGSGAKNLTRDNINTIGVSQNLIGFDFSTLWKRKNKKNQNESILYKNNHINETTVNNMSNVLPGQRLGIKMVTNNAIKSLYQKLNRGL